MQITDSEACVALKSLIETWNRLKEQIRLDFPLLSENEREALCSKAMDRIFNLNQGDKTCSYGANKYE